MTITMTITATTRTAPFRPPRSALPWLACLLLWACVACAAPTQILDDFESYANSGNDQDDALPAWLQSSQNAHTGSTCSALGSTALFLRGPARSARFLRTVALDTRSATSIQLSLVGGGGRCDAPDKGEGLTLSYSASASTDEWVQIATWDISYPNIKKAFVDIVVPLPDGARGSSVSFRFEQEAPDKVNANGDVWVIDNLYIGGVALADRPKSTVIDFDDAEATAEALLFTVGDSDTAACTLPTDPDRASRLALSDTSAGGLWVTTRDFNSASFDYMQLFLALCRASPEAEPPTSGFVYIEVSTDFGASWTALRVLHVTEIQGWSRVTFHLESALPTTARFRVRGTSAGFAVDRIFVGRSEAGCSNSGLLNADGSCSCTVGYSGPHCATTPSFPTSLRDTFDLGDATQDNWPSRINAVITPKCSSIEGSALTFKSATGAPRQATTRRLDTRDANVLQYDISRGTCNEPERNEDLFVHFSTDGGLSWTLLDTATVAEVGARRWVTRAATLPAAARTSFTLFRFSQTDFDTLADVWAVDNVFIGEPTSTDDLPVGVRAAFDGGEDDLREHLLWNTGGVLAAESSERCIHMTPGVGSSALFFEETTDNVRNLASTFDMALPEGGIVQIVLAGCLDIQENDHVTIDASADYGQTLTNLGVVASSELAAGGTWRRFTFSVPPMARGRITVSSEPKFPFALDYLFVGATCADHCHGHGRCESDGSCVCDEQYEGENCALLTTARRQLRDNFDDVSLDRHNGAMRLGWGALSNAEFTSACGALSGRSLRLGSRQQGPRYAITRPLQLGDARLVQFYASSGGTCNRAEPKRDEGLVVQYSTNGGVDWTTISTIEDWGGRPRWKFFTFDLPADARSASKSTMFRFKQNKYDRTADDWVIDELFIGEGFSAAGTQRLAVNFDAEDGDHAPPSAFFVSYAAATATNTCGAYTGNYSLVFARDQAAHLSTVTMDLSDGGLIQYFIKQCPGFSGSGVAMLEYSTDFGATWTNIRTSHLAVLPVWTRVNVLVPDGAKTDHTRLRWAQDGEPVFAIDSVDIAPVTCPGSGRCYSRGQCMNDGTCQCDPGYSGDDCGQLGGDGHAQICSQKLDVFLVIDGSGSIGSTRFKQVRKWAAGVIDGLAVAEGQARVGVIQFAQQSGTRVELELTYDAAAAKSKVSSMRYMSGKATDIQEGLLVARTRLADSRKDKGRKQVPKVIILFTDGTQSSGQGDPVAEADAAKADGIELYGVAVGSTSATRALEKMASEPVDRHVYSVANFDDMVEINKDMAKELCIACFGAIDVMLVIDGSGSINANQFEQVRLFTRNVIGSFSIDEENGAHAGAVQFGTNAELIAPLSGDLVLIDDALVAMVQDGGGTFTAKGLELAGKQLLEGGRPDVPNVIILLTDGSSSDRPVVVADRLRAQGIEFFGVGIGRGTSSSELQDIADGVENVFSVDEFEELPDVVRTIVRQTCTQDDSAAKSAVSSIVSPPGRSRQNNVRDADYDHDRAPRHHKNSSFASFVGLGIGVGLVAMVGVIAAVVVLRRRRRRSSVLLAEQDDDVELQTGYSRM